jgi:GH15 family glucan-1,4-alpha-glucosidase
VAYLAISDYGIIGNMHTAAVIGKNGSIDWFCYPYFDSPSIFGSILDEHKGGQFAITPVNASTVIKQFYYPDTNILVTRFLAPEGEVEVTDWMPIDGTTRIIRQIDAVRGELPLTIICQPAFDYARQEHHVERSAEGFNFHGKDISFGLASSIPLDVVGNGVKAQITLKEGQKATLLFHQIEQGGDCGCALTAEETDQLFRKTVTYWHNWIAKCTYKGRWREAVIRSALTLKLLTFEPTGAIVAAVTTSLPEHIGGERNWDYRYTWIRDAAFTVYALMRIGFTDEAEAFMRWLDDRSREPDEHEPLQPVYGIRGQHTLVEETLDHLEGYCGSRPVRIGNAAYKQFQLDIYGELLDAAYLYNKYVSMVSYDMWLHLRRLIDWVCENWQRTDLGIWEIRAEPQAFVFSKLMCWVTVDRGLRLADKRSFPANRARWIAVRDEIYNDIMEHGWDDTRGAFTQHYNTTTLDAANLIMPLVFFVAPNDPKMLETVAAISQPVHQGGLMSGHLVYRYNHLTSPDGLQSPEGMFNMCTFWLVEALTRANKLVEARLLFERMLTYANHLGLYAEQTAVSGEALGNVPQALTHLALISAAFNLDRALNGEKPGQRTASGGSAATRE